MGLVQQLQQGAVDGLLELFGAVLPAGEIQVSLTKPEFKGDYTLVMFSLGRLSGTSPEATGQQLGAWLTTYRGQLVCGFNVIKGFLNLEIPENWLMEYLDQAYLIQEPGSGKVSPGTVMVEFSSPNTNKPLHLGHLRNNFLGDSVAEILAANGYQVVRANLINDRGIHICKSMVAWQLFAAGETPASAAMKGDHFVGKYYVLFNDRYKEEVAGLVSSGMDEAVAEKEAPLMKAAQHMLRQWEAGDPGTRGLWERMNSWVYEGFEVTYRELGIRFDRTYYESNTYLLGRAIVLEGLEKGVFFRKPDGSVWVDLTADGLDEKLLMRGDGTSVYITQDLGTAELKYEDFRIDRSIYVIADEQNYHMKVLALVLAKLGKPYGSGVHHLSYGMVDLTTGKMKSREGTVVDADDLIESMISTAAAQTEALGKVKDFSDRELEELHSTLGIGAMKFFLLRVNPKKRMVFDPQESIDLNGFTGPFIQYTYARIRSICRREELLPGAPVPGGGQDQLPLLGLERSLLLILEQYDEVLRAAARELDPSVLAGYLYLVAKSFNSLYAELPIARAEEPGKKSLRLKIALLTASVISRGMHLLRIAVPERM